MLRVISNPSASRVALGDDTDHLGRRQPGVAELAEQPPLAFGEVVGQLLDDVGDVAGLDQADHVSVKTGDLVQPGDRPVVESFHVTASRPTRRARPAWRSAASCRYQLAEEGDEELSRFGAALDRHDELLRVGLEDRVAGQPLQAHLGAGLQRQRRQSRLAGGDRHVAQTRVGGTRRGGSRRSTVRRRAAGTGPYRSSHSARMSSTSVAVVTAASRR